MGEGFTLYCKHAIEIIWLAVVTSEASEAGSLSVSDAKL